ncbi:MAG: CofH family radical SAM protein [Planctomycetes bacterium]|nr:CofH family radical SAM protein [Planctomycetota bacterium]
MDPKIILETARNREEISAIEALLLLQEGPAILPSLFELADELTRRSHGTTVTYVRGKRIHYTNLCRAECSFCSFRRKKGQKNAFVLSPDEVVRQIRESGSARQVTLKGGLNPDLNLNYHLDVLRSVREEFPSIHVEAYSPSEIQFIARRARTSVGDVLRRFREAGMDSMTGDSADILNDKVRKKICPDKLRTNDWVDVVKTAHRLGIPTTAMILFGHVEDEINTCEHFEILRNIQKETGGFTAFEPVPFMPQGSPLAKAKKIKSPPPLESILRLVAISRLFFCRYIRNITVDWTKLGLAGAVEATRVGANDLGTLAVDSHEMRSPEVNGRLVMPAATVKSAVAKAGRETRERAPYDARTLPTIKTRKEELVLV